MYEGPTDMNNSVWIDCGGRGCAGQRGTKGGGNWDNCNKITIFKKHIDFQQNDNLEDQRNPPSKNT